MRRTFVVAALVALAAAPVAAQQPPAQAPVRGGMMGGMAMDGQMKMGGGEAADMGPLTAQWGKYAPSAVLEMKAHLSLTADQEAKLTALVEEGKKAETEAHMPAHAAHMELNKAMAADPIDTEVARAMFLAHHHAEGNMQWIRVSNAMNAKALLTAVQRAHVESMGGGAMKH